MIAHLLEPFGYTYMTNAMWVSALVGAVCADQITPYPPGVPVLVPGQVISREVLEYLRSILLSQRNIEVHGLTYRQDLPYLRIAIDNPEAIS